MERTLLIYFSFNGKTSIYIQISETVTAFKCIFTGSNVWFIMAFYENADIAWLYT